MGPSLQELYNRLRLYMQPANANPQANPVIAHSAESKFAYFLRLLFVQSADEKTSVRQKNVYGMLMKLWELDITGFIQLIVYALLGKNITILGSLKVFDERISQQVFLHDAFHFGVRQRSQKLILHHILDRYLKK